MSVALIYARVSTEEQAKEGQSLEAQFRICEQYASNNGIVVKGKFVDEGKSATNMRRQALQELLATATAKDSGVDTILVQDTDRLARNTIDHLQIKAVLRKSGVEVVAVSQPMIDNSPEGNLIDTLLAATNAFQSQITGRKTSKVMEQKAMLGWYPGGTPPLGYLNVNNPKSVSSLDRRIVSIDPTTGDVVRKMFEKYAQGIATTADIVVELNEQGVRSPQNSRIHKSLIIRTLANPFYIGEFAWKGKVYQGKHEKLITKELFKQVQDVLSASNRGASRKRKHNFLLRGFVFCSECNHRMIGEKHEKNGNMYSFYYCRTCGKGTYIDSELLESSVSKRMARIAISDQYRELVLATASDIIQESRDSRASELARLQKEEAVLNKALRIAEDDRYMSHSITAEDFTRLSERYREQLVKVRTQLESLDSDYTDKLRTLERVLMLAENIGQAYMSANEKLKREYLSLFLSRIKVRHGKVVSVEYNPALEQLIKDGSVRISTIRLPR